MLLSPDDLESLEEILAILSNPNALQQIREAESEIDGGDVVTADRLRAKYQTRRLRRSLRSPVGRSAR